MMFLYGVIVGLLVPYLARAMLHVIRHRHDTAIPISRERRQMMIKDHAEK